MKALRFIGFALLACSLLLVSCKKTKQYTITVTVNDASMGSATGGGVYDENATATLTATANPGSKFVNWEDGNTDNPRTVTVSKDESYCAVFEACPDGIQVAVGDETWTIASFFADAETYAGYGKLYVVMQKNQNSEFPQIRGLMSNSIGTATESDYEQLNFSWNASEIDENGNTQWSSENIQTVVTAIDLTAHTISATQSGSVRNRISQETKGFTIVYKNANWTPTIIHH